MALWRSYGTESASHALVLPAGVQTYRVVLAERAARLEYRLPTAHPTCVGLELPTDQLG